MREPQLTQNTAAARRRSIPEWLWYGAGGFSLGIVLAVITVGMPLLEGGRAGSEQAPEATVEPSASPIPTDTPSFTETARAEMHDLVEAGCSYVSDLIWDPGMVIEVLAPHLGEMTEAEDLIRAYGCLAYAESLFEHYQMAAYYSEQLSLLDPTAQNIFVTGQYYDMGGDLEKAVEFYLLVVKMDDPTADMYRDFAMQRIADLEETLQKPPPAP